MSLIKTLARKVVFPLVTAAGIEKIFSALSENNKLILVYHGVVDSPNHAVSVGPIALRQFEQHLQYFKRHFEVVSQEKIFAMYRESYRPQKKTIALTFDDGYANNFNRVYPLLKKYHFPATMYVISSGLVVGGMITWYDYLDFVKDDLDVRQLHKGKFSNIEELKRYVQTINYAQRQQLFAAIATQVDIKIYKKQNPEEHWKLMNSAQVRELSNSGLIEIAAHSHTHPNLGEIKPEDAKEEITQSKAILEEVLQKEVRSIAFPDGSYTERVKKICIDAGYKNLLAVDYRCHSDLADKNILPRYCISSTTTYESNMIQVNRSFKTSGF